MMICKQLTHNAVRDLNVPNAVRQSQTVKDVEKMSSPTTRETHSEYMYPNALSVLMPSLHMQVVSDGLSSQKLILFLVCVAKDHQAIGIGLLASLLLLRAHDNSFTI